MKKVVKLKRWRKNLDGFHYYFSHYSGAVKPTIGILGLLKSEDGNHLKTYNVHYGSDEDVTMDGIELAINFIILIILGRVENASYYLQRTRLPFDNMGNWQKMPLYTSVITCLVGTSNTGYRSNKLGR